MVMQGTPSSQLASHSVGTENEKDSRPNQIAICTPPHPQYHTAMTWKNTMTPGTSKSSPPHHHHSTTTQPPFTMKVMCLCFRTTAPPESNACELTLPPPPPPPIPSITTQMLICRRMMLQRRFPSYRERVRKQRRQWDLWRRPCRALKAAQGP